MSDLFKRNTKWVRFTWFLRVHHWIQRVASPLLLPYIPPDLKQEVHCQAFSVYTYKQKSSKYTSRKSQTMHK